MDNNSALPHNTQRWKELIANNGLANDRIHGAKYTASGSGITLQQFLLLRVLWLETKLPKILNDKHWPDQTSRGRAKAYLASTSWEAYLDAIRKDWTDSKIGRLGEFSTVRQSQIPLRKTVLRQQFWTAPKVAFDDFLRRNDSYVPSILPPDPPSPTPASGDIESMELDLPDISSRSSMTAESPAGMLSPMQRLCPGDEKEIPVVKDEEIVSMSLINFLRALVVGCRDVSGFWSPHRLPFIVRNPAKQSKIYEARVDGYLESAAEELPCAIIEVKPFTRYDNAADKIKMQEAAQMAAWISQHPPKDYESHKGHMTRLLISQDRHEVFLTLATFNAAYVRFIRHDKPTRTSFLRMQDYGPFDMFKPGDVDLLGEILLAFAMVECPAPPEVADPFVS